MNLLDVSFVIPIVSFKSHLKETLRSIFDLKGLETIRFEVIIVQNGKKEAVPNWPSSFTDIKVIHCHERSIPKARNLGISASNFNFIAFLDDDSVCPENWLLEAFSFFKSSHVAAFQSATNYYSYFPFTGLVRKKTITRQEDHYLHSKQHEGVIHFDTGASLFRKAALMEVVGFDESFLRVEDFDIATRLSLSGWTLAYGKTVVGGEERSTFFHSVLKFVMTSSYQKRLYQKFGIPVKERFFPEKGINFRKLISFELMFHRFLYVTSKTLPSVRLFTERRLRFLIVFNDDLGRSFILKSKYSLLISTNHVVLLIGRTRHVPTDDKYLYEKFFHAEERVIIEIGKIKDVTFMESLTPFLFARESNQRLTREGE